MQSAAPTTPSQPPCRHSSSKPDPPCVLSPIMPVFACLMPCCRCKWTFRYAISGVTDSCVGIKSSCQFQTQGFAGHIPLFADVYLQHGRGLCLCAGGQRARPVRRNRNSLMRKCLGRDSAGGSGENAGEKAGETRGSRKKCGIFVKNCRNSTQTATLCAQQKNRHRRTL